MSSDNDDDSNDDVFDDVIRGRNLPTCREEYPVKFEEACQWYKTIFFGNFKHAGEHNRLASIAVAGEPGRFLYLEQEYKDDPHVVRIAFLKALYNNDRYCLDMILKCATESALDANADVVEQVRAQLQ
jgi:hypothetical protein